MVRISLRLTGATEFVDTSAIATFQEGIAGDSLSSDWAAVIKYYTYNAPSSTPHTINLTLRPTWNANADEQIIVSAPTSPVNSRTYLCGPGGGIVVPRRFGIEATSQPVSGGSVVTQGTSYNLFFTTTGKDAAGTFTFGYQWELVS